jgi:murein L,D-transpeptidase YcbB/YkuD
MSNRRFRIMAGTAMALILAAPLVSMAKNAATPMATLPNDQLWLEVSHASVARTTVHMTVATQTTVADSANSLTANDVQGTAAFAISTDVPATHTRTADTATADTATADTATADTVTAGAAAAGTASVTDPVPPPDPLASLDPADRPIAENIRDLFAAGADKLFASSNERAAVEAFYSGRNFAPLWIEKGIETARAASVVARLKQADADGLDSGEYRTPSFAGPGPDAVAEADLRLTRAVLTFARHLQAGRFPYNRVSRNIELPQASPEPADVLNNVANADDAGKALDLYSPQNEPYRKLKAKLAELRGNATGAKGETRQIEIIVANMERWRWYPRDLGTNHVLVNHPDFTLKVMQNGKQVWTTRVVIGKPSMATPLLSETMKSITVNPTWTVPQSIVRNEYLPALAQDPTVLDRMGLRVSYNSGGGVTITQPPGAGNALGRVRFNINNRFSVFQHDTPDKNYFGHAVRAYSHGCMRVQDPATYAEVLLKIARPGEHWSAERIQRMYGGSERNLQVLPTMIWVHLTYQTAFVDDTGKLQMRRDVYNLDSRTIAAIKKVRGNLEAPERKREEIAGSSPRKPATPARTGSLPQPIYR